MKSDAPNALEHRTGDDGAAVVGRRLCVGPQAVATRRRLGPVAWAVLEVLVTVSEPIESGGLTAETNVRAIAGALGLSKDTVAAALTRLIDGGFVRRKAARFTRSQYQIVGNVGVRPCLAFSRPVDPDTNISDTPGPCDSPIPRQTDARYEWDESLEPLRLFE